MSEPTVRAFLLPVPAPRTQSAGRLVIPRARAAARIVDLVDRIRTRLSLPRGVTVMLFQRVVNDVVRSRLQANQSRAQQLRRAPISIQAVDWIVDSPQPLVRLEPSAWS